MARLFPILFVLVFAATELCAQKRVTVEKKFKEAHASIKSGSGQENAERILLDSLAKPVATPKQKAEGYHICALLQQSMNDGLNMSAYLKQKIDTARLYGTVLKIYEYTLRSDTADEGRRFANRNIRLRALHRKNLLGGGKYLLKSLKWSEAYPYFDMFLKTRTTDMDSLVGRVAYWATVCGMNENNPKHVLEYVDTAIVRASPRERAALTEYKARCNLHLGDSLRWLAILEDGVDRYPGYDYFFLNLMDYYMRHGELERGMARTDSLVKADGDRAVYWFAMSMFALAEEDYGKCIAMSDECLTREPDNMDALYNKGISLLNMALRENSASGRRAMYCRALEPMERVRELSPEDVGRWGNPLYRIYLNLNMGRKFEEIDVLLEKHAAVSKADGGGNVTVEPDKTTDTPYMDKRLSRP